MTGDTLTPTWDRWQMIVPARLESSRLPHKPLQDLGGKPLVVRVLDNLAAFSRRGVQLQVATDAAAIVTACADHGYQAQLTETSHQSGTDRCYELAKLNPARPYVLNVQCDEPFLDTYDMEQLMLGLEGDPAASIATLAHKCSEEKKFKDPNAVKVVMDSHGRALYFSRAGIPYCRDTAGVPPEFWIHIGLYAYRLDAMKTFCALPPSPLELLERLEQLRALEHGMKLNVIAAQHIPVGIDTPEDLEEARARF